MPPKQNDDIGFGERMKIFLSVHWRGIIVLLTPILALYVVTPFPGELYMWVAYTLIVMAIFWVTECIPLAVTGFIPIITFPLRGVTTTQTCSKAYINDTIVMFLGSLFLAASVEQSGLHKRLAYFTIRVIGYSHIKLLLALCIVTTFVSMWITNTAATVMMLPINFAILKVFESQKVLKLYEKNEAGEEYASEFTICYFCAAAYSASVGGIGTLVGTGTNLVFKGLFVDEYPDAPEYLSFPLFSAFAVPYMIILEVFVFLSMGTKYLGLFRPNSAAAKRARITEAAKTAARETIEKDTAALGSLTFWEIMVTILFGGAMISFFCRSPQIFPGWGDKIVQYYGIENIKFIRDSALAMFISTLMLMSPSDLSFFKNFTAKYKEDLPKRSVPSVLDWVDLNRTMPYSFMYLLGGGFALSSSAKSSGLNDQLGILMSDLKSLPNSLVLFLLICVVTFVTNFASNVAVANVFVPIGMTLAKRIDQNPLLYCIVTGFTCSYAFMLPVGTPPNLVIQSAAKIPTRKMMVAGIGPSISTIIITWLVFTYWAPIIWPVIKEKPEWVK